MSRGRCPLPAAHRLVGDADDLRFEEFVSERRQRRQMQIGEQDQTFAEVDVLQLDGLLHLDDHLGLAPHKARVTDDFRAGILVLRIRESGLRACKRFDENGVTSLSKRLNARRGHATRASLSLISLGTPTIMAASPQAEWPPRLFDAPLGEGCGQGSRRADLWGGLGSRRAVAKLPTARQFYGANALPMCAKFVV